MRHMFSDKGFTCILASAFHATSLAVFLTTLPLWAWADLPEPLQTGQVRFQLLTGEPLTALAHNPQPSNREQRLLHAQSLADLGLHQAAREELEALASADSSIAAQAGLELVRLALKTQDLSSAGDWLEKTLPQLQGQDRQEGLFRQAELMRQRGDLSGAAAVLGRMEGSTWTGIGYFNLAAAYADRDQSSSRPLVALRVAAATSGARQSLASAEVVDRSHLGGGLLALREEDYAKAVSFLEKVRLDSYQAPGALYLHGLAHLKQDNVRGALQSWHRARKFPLAFPGTPEAYIAMGQGFDEAGATGQAADAFLAANAAFEKERVVLSELDQGVQKQGAYQALILASRQNDVEWFLDNSQAVTAPRLAWLMRFMEAPAAQQGVRRLAELDQMDRRLEQKSADLEVMRQSLSARLKDARDAARGSQTGASARLQDRIETLQARGAALQKKYDDAVADSRMDVLVSGELASRFDRLKTLAKAARHHGDLALQERVRRLRGIALWQAQDSFERDRDALEASLDRVREQLDEADAALEQFERKVKDAPEQFEQYLARVGVAEKKVSDQRERIAGLKARSEKALTKDVREFISDQQTQLELLADRSEQEIAHLYEHMAVTRLKADQRSREAQ